MSLPLRTVAYLALAFGTLLTAALLLLPYLSGAPQVLIVPGLVVALCVFVVVGEVPTRRRTRARLSSDASPPVAVWEYSAAEWYEAVRHAPLPSWGTVLSSALLNGLMVAMAAGIVTEDLRALALGTAWGVAWACALQAFFTYRDARLLADPHRRLRMMRNVVLLGPQFFILNPEPSIPELSRSKHLHGCEASASAGGAGLFAGTITFTCVQMGRNSRGRVEHRFFVPRAHAHDVARVVSVYTDIAAPNRADSALALPP